MNKPSRLLFFALLLSLLGNAFQLLWITSEDTVLHMTREEIEQEIERTRLTQAEPARWSWVLVNTPELVVLEVATMIHFRGLFTNEPRRRLCIHVQPRR